VQLEIAAFCVSLVLLTKVFTVVDRRFFFVALHTSAVLDLGIELRVHANPHPDSVTVTCFQWWCLQQEPAQW
jgi:hypothetical protein